MSDPQLDSLRESTRSLDELDLSPLLGMIQVMDLEYVRGFADGIQTVVQTINGTRMRRRAEFEVLNALTFAALTELSMESLAEKIRHMHATEKRRRAQVLRDVNAATTRTGDYGDARDIP